MSMFNESVALRWSCSACVGGSSYLTGSCAISAGVVGDGGVLRSLSGCKLCVPSSLVVAEIQA